MPSGQLQLNPLVIKDKYVINQQSRRDILVKDSALCDQACRQLKRLFAGYETFDYVGLEEPQRWLKLAELHGTKIMPSDLEAVEDEQDRLLSELRGKSNRIQLAIESGQYSFKFSWGKDIAFPGLVPDIEELFFQHNIQTENDPKILNLKSDIISILDNNGVRSKLAQATIIDSVLAEPAREKASLDKQQEGRNLRETNPDYLRLIEKSRFKETGSAIASVLGQAAREESYGQSLNRVWEIINKNPGYEIFGVPVLIEGRIQKIFSVFRIQPSVTSVTRLESELQLRKAGRELMLAYREGNRCLVVPLGPTIFKYDPKHPDNYYNKDFIVARPSQPPYFEVCIDSFALPNRELKNTRLMPKDPALVEVEDWPVPKSAAEYKDGLVKIRKTLVVGEHDYEKLV